MIKSISVLLITIFCIVTSYSQDLILIDSTSQEEVIGALVQINNTNYISDKFGKIKHTYVGTQIITISHLNYQTYQKTVDLSRSINIYLTPKSKQLEEVIVTGQFKPKSAKNSVFSVKSIDQTAISGTGATNLLGVLSTELNIHFNRDNATGSSSLSLQGISGQNIKVLLDGIPIFGRSGTQNEVDISQIDLNTIERIEIVEGPMSVIYGADALAGVINIITKKDSEGKEEISLGIHEETVANNYSLFSEGIHNTYLNISRKFNKNWYVQIGGAINKFGGWQGNSTDNDERNKLWYPKTQYFGNALLRYSNNDLELHYRSDYSYSFLENLGAIQDNGLFENTAVDEEYRTDRWMHQVQATVDLNQSTLETAISYSRFNRTTSQFNKYLESGREVIEENMEDEQDSSYLNTLFMRTMWATSLSDKVQTQLGIDGTIENGKNSKLSAGTKELMDTNIFLSANMDLGSKISLRPGIRYGYNSIYKAPLTPSLNLKYNITKSIMLRMGYGRGFRAPALTELYYEFVDANHRIFGNEDLQPEYSHNLNGEISYSKPVNNNTLDFRLASFYNYIDNRITFITPQENNPDNNTILTNLLLYKTTGVTAGVNWNTPSNSIRINIGITGRYQLLSEIANNIPQFVYSPEVVINTIHQIPSQKISISVNYKYTGATKQYVLNDESVAVLQTVEGYHWLNMTADKSFGKSFKLMLGVKNLLNIVDVNASGASGSTSAHGGSGSSRPVSYGRSFFIRLNYLFKLK